MSKIDDVFSAFEDGREHGADEVAKRVSLQKPKVLKVLDFLAEFGFIEFDRRKGKAKVGPAGMRLLSIE